MQFLQRILAFLDTKWEKPTVFGGFHFLCLFLMVFAAILLCFLWKKKVIKNPQKVVLFTAITVLIFEIYRQINFTFGDGTSPPAYQWFIFPWQFCSTPLYIGLLAGFSKGKLREHFDAYLATYTLFAGLVVMLFPGDVFTPTIGICIETMVCHGSMVAIAVFLFYTGYVKAELKTLWKALPIFAITLSIAVILNELAYYTGILENHVFNMFYVSRHCPPTLAVFSAIQNAILDYPWGFPVSIMIYFVGFTILAFLMLSVPMVIRKCGKTDFEARYAEQDRLRLEQAHARAEKKAARKARKVK